MQMRGLLISLLIPTALKQQDGAGADNSMLIDAQRRLVTADCRTLSQGRGLYPQLSLTTAGLECVR